MNFRLMALVLVGSVLMTAAGVIVAEEAAEAPQPACPISGRAIDKSVSADYLGAKVYFCCGGCAPKFKANTAKYATKANRQLILTGQATQTACPLTGRDTNKDTALAVGGIDVTFCCGRCRGKVAKAETADQWDLVFGKGFSKGFTVKAQ